LLYLLHLAACTVLVLVAIFVALFGLAFGSFLNVCIVRLPRHTSLIRPASRCPHCKTAIRPADNIPLLSWLLLQGRCRNCQATISWRYPLVEAGTAVLFLLSFLSFGISVQGIGMDVLCFLLLGLAATDAETMTLPDAFTVPGILLGVTYCWLVGGIRAAAFSILWAAGAGLLIVSIRLIYSMIRHREGMGMGDAKLLALTTAWLGPELAGLGFFLGIIGASIYGLSAAMSRRHQQDALALRLPLGSFLCAGAVFAIFDGEQILKWYLQFFR
jgi:leader peptidase (prepilin peptidase)/N-methyltransferase